MQRFSRSLLTQSRFNSKLSTLSRHNVKVAATRHFSTIQQTLGKMSTSFIALKGKALEKRDQIDRAILASIFPVASCSNGIPPAATTDVAGVPSAEAVDPNTIVDTLAYTPPETWSKAGIILDKPIWVVDTLYHTLDIPLWVAIVGLGVVVRTLTAPLAIKQQFASIRMTLIQPEVQKLSEAMKRCPPGSLAVREIQQKMMDIFKKHDVNPVKTMAFAALSFPFMIASFMGVRNMALDPDYHDIFINGGFGPFLDLTVDSGWLVAAVATASNLLIFKMQTMGMKPSDIPAQQKMLTNVMSAVLIASLPLMANMPLAVMVYLLTNNVYTALLNLVLRTDVVRRICNMPTAAEVLALKRKYMETAAVSSTPFTLPTNAPKTAYVLPTAQQAEAAKFQANLGPRRKRFVGVKEDKDDKQSKE